MSISQLAELQVIISEFKLLKDHDDGVAQLEGQAKSLASGLKDSPIFLENASEEEKALVQKYAQE